MLSYWELRPQTPLLETGKKSWMSVTSKLEMESVTRHVAPTKVTVLRFYDFAVVQLSRNGHSTREWDQNAVSNSLAQTASKATQYLSRREN